MHIRNKIRTNLFDKKQMKNWRRINNIPAYIDASYVGATGVKERFFPVSVGTIYKKSPNITSDVFKYEEEILQDLKDIRRRPFGYIRALWHMSQQFSTGEPWDSKFMPQFPGRTKKGEIQYATYNETIVSTNDLSNIIYGHICRFMKIPKWLAKYIAKLDACGAIELITKGKFPNKKLLKFKDTESDQLAIERGYQDFNIKNYRLL